MLFALTCSRSSAVQILPAIQPIVESLTTFIRSPLWLLPAIAKEQGNYSKELIEDFQTNPKSLIQLRKINETVVNSIFCELVQKIKQMLRLTAYIKLFIFRIPSFNRRAEFH